MINLDLVIVTYNRLEKLKKALDCYEKQTCSFRNLILVDNCSTDGTREFVDDWSKKQSPFPKIVIHTQENIGGAGGFYTGQKEAMRLDADWVYVADDDAYAAPDMVEKFYHFIDTHDVSRVSAVCGAVYGTDGTLSYGHRSFFKIENKRFVRWNAVDDDYHKDFFEINFLSYVGSFIRVAAMRRVGLVNRNYFIFYDDTEHSLRLKKYGPIYCVPVIKIEHETIPTKTRVTNNYTVSWKDYYGCRNEMRMLLKHYPSVAVSIFYSFFKHYFRDYSNRKKKKLVKDAYFDALIGRMGIHSLYRPGWSMEISL